MAELKRNFSQAKMNKDLDERVIPPGQYRDANNIEIATSEGSNVGTVQTIRGNVKHGTMIGSTGYYGIPNTATCVASIASEDTDKIYYFVSSGDLNNSSEYADVRKDYILEYDTIHEKHKYVFVDIFYVKTTNAILTGDQSYLFIPAGSSSTINTTGVRIGMTLTTSNGYGLEDEVKVTDIIKDSQDIDGVQTDVWKIVLSKSLTDANCSGSTHNIPVDASVEFTPCNSLNEPARVLNFSKRRLITAVNILDGNIYWTDNFSEPKKVNIERSIMGTGGNKYLMGGDITVGIIGTALTTGLFTGNTDYFHTRLVVTGGNQSRRVVTQNGRKEAVYAKEEHLTIIKKAPVQPLELDMYRGRTPRIDPTTGTENPSWGFTVPDNTADYYDTAVTGSGGTNADLSGQSNGSMFDDSDVLLSAEDKVFFALAEPRDFRAGDILLFSDADNVNSLDNYSDWQVKAKVLAGYGLYYHSSGPNEAQWAEGIRVEIIAISQDVTASQTTWKVKLDEGDSLFEFKFPRFSYRYRYQDGEYSTFAPWSQIAFLPDSFDYVTNQGYNLGMVNQLRSLTLKGFFASESIRPRDLLEVDILYKEAGNPTVYLVETLSGPYLNRIMDIQDDGSVDERGSVNITSDSIHAVIPSNQLLRPWDNVPRFAKAQEVSANRLIYGNYTQNYSFTEAPGVSGSFVNEVIDTDIYKHAAPSVKSMREYTIGVVYSDKYGRETPVLKGGNVKIPKAEYSADGNFTLNKYSSTRNRLTATIYDVHLIPSWAKYFSYYIKETSTEYYNLVMDRWYEAEDGNIWLSFPSSERNKVDEGTFIKLKKKHGSNVPSTESSKYKIITIKNEAPNTVRDERKLLGTLYNQNSYVGNSEEGYPLQGFKYFTVQQGAFEDILDFGVISSAVGRSVRFGGAGLVSNYYKVSNVTLANQKYRIELEDHIAPDAAFVATSDTFATAISDLYIEFFETKSENKPEFDGRFFVKINKDAALQNEVLVATQDSSQLQIERTWPLRYVNNNGYVSGLGTPIPHDAQTRVIGGSYGDNLTSQHPTEYSHHTLAAPDGLEQTKYFWGGAAAADTVNVEVPDGDGITTVAINTDPVAALNDNYYSNEGDAKRFWDDLAAKKDFFIDGATAYTFTGRVVPEVLIDGSQGNTGTDNINNNPNNGVDDYVWEDWQTVYSGLYESPELEEGEGAPSFGGTPNTCNLKAGKGVPSRGIWDSPNGSYMDISWTGMGAGYDGSNASWANGDFPHQLKDVVGEPYAGAWKFIQKLVTKDTKFRFQRDPDGTEYVVKGVNLYDDITIWDDGTNNFTGAFGIRNFRVDPNGTTPNRLYYSGSNLRQRWTIEVEPKIGGGDSGYNPIYGTGPNGPINTDSGYRRALNHDGTGDPDVIEILSYATSGEGNFIEESAIWETEPKDAAELDIYYQASGLNPLYLTEETNEEFIPIGSTFNIYPTSSDPTSSHTVTDWVDGQTLNFDGGEYGQSGLTAGTVLTFTIRDSYKVTAVVRSQGTNQITLYGKKGTTETDYRLASQTHTLDWNNCWVFGNGVESDRIRDDYNAAQIDNGVKASSTISGTPKSEQRKHGLIWSGIYNSTSGINDTNQFIMAEKITKDINPIYGSIQKLYNRDTRLIMFCEDKILRAVTNKDALYNADGKPQLVASNAVIGDVTPYQGDYGISTNPESFAATPYQIYFTDVARGEVLRMTNEGIVSISDKGMKGYFSTYMAKHMWTSLGTYDARKAEYNLTLSKQSSEDSIGPYSQTTISYSELSQGWVSFKSFYPQHGVDLNNKYYTFYNGHIWEHHHSNATYNTFYEIPHSSSDYSSVTLMFNDKPESVKSFGTINYEGSQARISEFGTVNDQNYFTGDYSTNGGLLETDNITDGEYFNLTASNGWFVNDITTNQQKGVNIEFKDKEGKWFGYISGVNTTKGEVIDYNSSESEFATQGLGMASIVHDDATHTELKTIKVRDWNTGLGVGEFGPTASDSWGGSDYPLWNVVPNANWSVQGTESEISAAEFTASEGDTVASGQTVNLTIHNTDENGEWLGSYIEAKNFIIGGGPDEVAANADGSYTWDGTPGGWEPNASEFPSASVKVPWKVKFSNNGEIGTVENSVNVEVVFGSSFVVPASLASDIYLYLDIDQSTVYPPTEEVLNPFCIDLTWEWNDNQSVSLVTEHTTEELVAGDADNATKWKLSGEVEGYDPVKVLSINFVADEGYYYSPMGIDKGWHFVGTWMSDWLYGNPASEGGTLAVSNISWVEDPVTKEITSFTAVLTYHHPCPMCAYADNPVLTDPCSYDLRGVIDYNIIQENVPETNHLLHSVSYPQYVSASSSERTVQVFGSKNAPYKISLTKKTNVDSINTASTLGYYNFETRAFQTAETSLNATCNDYSVGTHRVLFPRATDTTRYDITIEQTTPNTTVGSEVPVFPGDAIITQCGVKTITIKPITYNASNFGTLPANITSVKEAQCDGSKPSAANPVVITVKGGTSGASSTRLVLNTTPSGIFAGMVVTGSGVAHGSTVSAISKNIVTLSTASTIANNTDIKFTTNTINLVPFTFTVVPNSTTLNINTATDLRTSIGGLSSVKDQINGTAAKTVTHTLDSTKGIVPGMVVTGDEVKVDAGTNLTVASVTSGTVVVLSKIQSFIDNARLKFSGGNASSDVRVHSIQANKVGSDIVITGYLEVNDLKATADVRVYIDDIISVT